MGEDPGPCYHRPPQSSMFQLPHLGSLNAPSIIGHSPINSLSADSGVADMASLRNGQFSQHNGWFYCLPRFRQTFTPPGLSYSSPREKQLPFSAYGSDNAAAAAASTTVNPSSGDAQKKFLVIDQSGGQTTLMVSSGIGTPFQCLTSWSSRHPNFPDLKDQVCGEANENDGSDSKSEMHEDPDELDALLYSSSDEDEDDDGFCSEDDEVTSTGHSPSTMTTHERRGSEEESMDEVAWPIRKRKQQEPLEEEDTASSGKPMMNIHTEYCLHDDNNDARSSCGNGNMGSDSKRIRREKIRETVSILEDMIPGGGGKGKDAVVVLDEAIQYLKSLQVNARALGLCPL